MSSGEFGGDPPCWAHLIEDDDAGEGGLVFDLGADISRSGGAVWSLSHGGDLDANLVRLAAGEKTGAHVNREVDVLVVVRSGDGELRVDDRQRWLGPDHLALVPKGSMRTNRGRRCWYRLSERASTTWPLGISPAREGDRNEPRNSA